MRIRLQNQLLLINILAVLLIIIVTFFPSNILRIILGLPIVLFFPGYILVAAIFPRRDSLDGIERVALSFGLSIAVVPLVGLILNYTFWGIRLYPVLISLTIFIIITSIVAWYRQRGLAQAERFGAPFNLSLPSWSLRIILGLPLVLLFPGYILVAALFPRRAALDSIERMALSFGLSIAVVPLVGLILNYTFWGIRLYPVLISLTIFIIITSIVVWYRQRGLAQAERFKVSFNLSLPSWRGKSFIDKMLSIILVAVILGAIGTLGYVIATPKVGEKFTEFYLGSEGKAIDYPRELRVGEEGRVMVGIINREHEIVSYQVKVRIDGVSNNQTGPLQLGHDEKWEEIVRFTPDRAGEAQKVELLLYKDGESEPDLKLRLWIDVKE